MGYTRTDFENQPVVSLHQVDQLLHLHFARPDNVAKCELVKSGINNALCHEIEFSSKRGESGADT